MSSSPVVSTAAAGGKLYKVIILCTMVVKGGKSVLLDQEKEFLGLDKDDGKKGKSRLVMGEISGFENFGKM